MGAMNILKTVGLIGRDGVLSKSSPGVFIQGLLVYGRNGQEIFRRNLDPDFYREAFLYSLKHDIPLVAYCGDRCLTLFDHPLVEAVHSVYCEPKAEIMPTVESLLAAAEIQKLLFLESIDDRISAILRPYWSKEAGDHANVIQAIPETLELVLHGASKGDGVKLLLDHLGASSKEIMAIGDGENGVEMLRLAGLGVALSNGSEKAKAVADVIGISNDEDGVADTIYRFLHSELLDRA
uniref:Sugar-phosphatase n=1 Tax=Opuntia streptacantha TaxID=393608 RepID=A0A7C8ZSN8_OPUST